MAIVLVEDDGIQADAIVRQLKKAFRGQTITVLATEHEFRVQFADLVARPPAAFVIDVMLQWSKPVPNMPKQPEDVLREGLHRAGFRCKEMLASDPRTRNVPVVLYTVLGKTDLRGELDESSDIYVQKGPEPNDLVMQLRKFLPTEGQRDEGSFDFSRRRRRA